MPPLCGEFDLTQISQVDTEMENTHFCVHLWLLRSLTLYIT